MDKSKTKQEQQNRYKEDPPKLKDQQKVYIKSNIRKKLEPRAKENIAKEVTERTFRNNKNTKRHKNKIKRLKSS